MSIKDTIVVDFQRCVASVDKPCDEKYARKLLQDWLKSNTMWKGGWEVVKDFRNWDDPLKWNFTLHNSFAGISFYKLERRGEL